MTDFTDKLVGSSRPGGAQEGCCRREIAYHNHLPLPEEVPELYHLFCHKVERVVNDNIASCHRGLDYRWESPGVRFGRFVYPED
ncbi:hypothetical protein ES703_89224 [subsurface metagenome]